jgi:hypothetical protein
LSKARAGRKMPGLIILRLFLGSDPFPVSPLDEGVLYHGRRQTADGRRLTRQTADGRWRTAEGIGFARGNTVKSRDKPWSVPRGIC